MAKRPWQDRNNRYMFRLREVWLVGTTNQRAALSTVFTPQAIHYELKMWRDFDGPILLIDVIKSMSDRDWIRNNPAFKGTLLK